MRIMICSCIVLALCVGLLEGGHYSGGTISWRVLPGTSRQVLFEWSMGWVLGAGPCAWGCSQASIGLSTSIFRSAGPFVCAAPYNCSFAADTNYIVTGVFDFPNSLIWNMDKWEQGANSFNYTFSRDGHWLVHYHSNNWRTLGYTNPNASSLGTYRLLTSLYLGSRSDTSAPNSSPKIMASPVYRFQCNCTTNFVHSILLPMSDADGDNIQCRFATLAEGGDAAFTLPHSTITSVPGFCNITIDISGGNFTCNHFYGVSLMVEDFPSSTIMIGTQTFTPPTPLSSVPSQFLVYTPPIVTPCNVMPTWVTTTPSPGAVIAATPGTSITIKFYALDNSGSGLASISINGPYGSAMGPSSGVDPDDMSRVNVSMVTWTWTPADVFASTNYSLCMIATDNFGKSGDYQCITLEVAAVLASNSSAVSSPGTSAGGISSKQTVGLAVGLALGLTAIVFLVVTLCCCLGICATRRRKKKQKEHEEEEKRKANATPETTNEAEQHTTQKKGVSVPAIVTRGTFEAPKAVPPMSTVYKAKGIVRKARK